MKSENPPSHSKRTTQIMNSRELRLPSTVHHSLFTLHPTPYTLHPIPYTLYRSPYIDMMPMDV